MEDLKPIRVFLEVARHLSFVAAARSLDMTPATITRIVAKLEADLGQQLLLRTTRAVSLTSAGALVAARYQPIVEAFDATTREITDAQRPDRGRLRITAPISFGTRLLPDLIAGFRLAYPNIDLDLRLSDALVDIMAEEVDLAIRISGPPGDKSTIWRKICEVPRHLVAAPRLLARIDLPKSPDDLLRDLCLSYAPDGRSETWELHKSGTTRTLRAGSGVITNNGDLLYDLAADGNGIALLPDFITATGLASGDVISLLPDWRPTPLWLTLFYPPYEQLPPLVATFSDYFEAHIRDQAGMTF